MLFSCSSTSNQDLFKLSVHLLLLTRKLTLLFLLIDIICIIITELAYIFYQVHVLPLLSPAKWDLWLYLGQTPHFPHSFHELYSRILRICLWLIPVWGPQSHAHQHGCIWNQVVQLAPYLCYIQMSTWNCLLC